MADRLRSEDLGQGWLGLYGRKSALNDRRRLQLNAGWFFSYSSGMTVTLTFFPSCFPFFRLLKRSRRSSRSTPLLASSLIPISKLILYFFPCSEVDRNLSLH